MAPTGSCVDPRAYGQPKPLSGAVENAKTNMSGQVALAEIAERGHFKENALSKKVRF
jgi:hypothetical protein